MSEEQTPATETPVTPQPTARQRFTDRVWGVRDVIVVAVVALLLGGVIGAGLASIGGHDRRDDRFGPGMHGRFDKHFTGRPGGPMMMPPGQRMKLQQREMRQFREFMKFRQWQRSHRGATPSPSSGAQG
jgi:hypothetical protein